MTDPASAATAIGWWGVPLAVLAGAVRVSTPFLFVSLGECITERSGRINLGLEGTLVMGAMCGYGVSYLSGSPWLGVLAAGAVGAALGALHAAICSLRGVNDIALGIALMLFGIGLAFYLGKPLIEPQAVILPSIDLGWWSAIPQLRAALRINALFLIGVALAPFLVWALKTTRWGLILRTADVAGTFDDAHLTKFQRFAPFIVEAELARTAVSDAGVETLSQFKNLRALHLDGTAVTGRTLGKLSSLSQLTYLNLSGTKVTSAAAAPLKLEPNLRHLYLFNTPAEPAPTADSGVRSIQ